MIGLFTRPSIIWGFYMTGTSAKRVLCSVLVMLAASTCTSAQQASAKPLGQTVTASSTSLSPGASIAVVMRQTVKADKASPGDEVLAEITVPVLQDGRILIPEGARVFGHVTSAVARTREHPESVLAVRFERAEWKDGSVALNAVIVRALGRPEKAKKADSYNPVNCIPAMHAFPQQSVSQPTHAPRFNCATVQPRVSDSGLPKLEDVYVHTIGDDPMGPTEVTSTKKNVTLPKGLNLELRQVAP